MGNEIMQRCPGCMRPLGEEPVCSDCGTPAQFMQVAPFLPLRTLLAQGRIGIGCAVEQNGDGITYIAFDEQTHKPVYVREFFPAAIALREPAQLSQTVMHGCEAVWHDCAQNFTELWRKLQRLRGLSALLSVTDVFEENGTTYAVYEYTEAMTLREFLLRGKLGYITWERARALLMPVLSTLGNLHQQGIIHRGISPNTLYFGADGKVRLGGFSIWQARTAHGDLTAELAEGYAALEQYGLDGQQGAWTDIYAFAAVLYRSLIGSDPDDAVSRRHNDRVMVPAQFAERIPAYVINALINAMQVFPEDRTRSVEQLRAELSASPTAVAHSAPVKPAVHSTATIPLQREKKPPAKKKTSGGVLALKTAGFIVLGAVILAVAVMGLFFRDQLANVLTSLGTTTSSPTVTHAPPTVGETIAVPLLEGQDWSDALKKEYKGKLTFEVTEVFDDDKPAGRIIRQDIEPDTKVALGSTVKLEVSGGPSDVEIPQVTGKTIEKATKALEALGFEVTANEVDNDGTHKAGTVKDVYPKEGESCPRGKVIFVAVWGEAPTQGTAPLPSDD